MKSHSTASARLPDFVEPMKAKLVEDMQPGNWITGSLLSSFTVPSQRSRRGAKRYSGRKQRRSMRPAGPYSPGGVLMLAINRLERFGVSRSTLYRNAAGSESPKMLMMYAQSVSTSSM